MRTSIRSKITLWYIAILSIALILFGVFIYFTLDLSLQNRDVQIMAGELQLFGSTETIASNDQLVNTKNNKEFSELSLITKSKQESDLKFSNNNEVNGEAVLSMMMPIINNLTSDTLKRVLYIIFSGAVIIIAIAASGGFFLTKKALKPIDNITNTVKEIDGKRLCKRLNFTGKEDEIVRLANTFDSMLDKIEFSFNQQKQFTQNASHELNNPLAVMKTNIEITLQDMKTKKTEYKETLLLINREIDRLSKITNDLLLLSKMDSVNEKNKFNTVNIKDITKKMLEVFYPKIKPRDLIIKQKYKGYMNILGEKKQIEQLIFNLIDNAVKYTDRKKEISINIFNDKQKENLIFKIENKSSLIEKKDLPYLFDRFYTKKFKEIPEYETTGNGLGLSVCKKIVEIHNGDITAMFNNINKTVTFQVIFPLL